MLFENLNLSEPILRALQAQGYQEATPIQEQAIPIVLSKTDLLGCAQTGTGKTGAFALPIIELIYQSTNQKNPKGFRPIRALVLTPTRELALQVSDNFKAYSKFCRLRHSVVFGGVPQNAQTRELRAGVDILVATPGRLLDLMAQGYVDLRNIEVLVLDEADRMLDMGFINDIKKIISYTPADRQTLFFSATMPPKIQDLASNILTNPAKIEIAPESSTVDTVDQKLYFVEKLEKRRLLIDLLEDPALDSVLVFSRTRHGADRLVKDLSNNNIRVDAIHGDKSQNARQRALDNFKGRRLRVLVATDIAARGIDVNKLSHVINFDIPESPDAYVHRIGRTGRAGREGTAISFCDGSEIEYLRDIKKLVGRPIEVITDQPYHREDWAEAADRPQRGGGGASKKPSNKSRSKWDKIPSQAARSQSRPTERKFAADRKFASDKPKVDTATKSEFRSKFVKGKNTDVKPTVNQFTKVKPKSKF